MPSPAQTECLARAKGFGASSEVESSRSKGKETTALMARKNLLSLFDEFARFGGDAAVLQTRGYRREKLTFSGLQPGIRLWSYAPAGRSVLPGGCVLVLGPH